MNEPSSLAIEDHSTTVVPRFQLFYSCGEPLSE
jgi:hypothetical protein